MPALTVEQAITEFNTSAVQAVHGCGQPKLYTINDSNSRILLTHPDGCRLDFPFEAIPAMSAEQYTKVFGALEGSDVTELLGELRGEMGNDLPEDAPLPEVSVDRTLFTAATGKSRFAAVRAMARGNAGLPFTPLDGKALNKRITKKARGRIFIKAMRHMGVIFPDDFALPIGDVLHAMYSSIESSLDDGQNQVRRISDAHHTWQAQVQAEVAASTDAIAALEADVAKTMALREAAIAWRSCTGEPDEKFAAFTKLMDSIDRVVEQPPAAPDLPAADHEFPPADLLAQFAEEEAAREAVPTADTETAR